MTDVETQTERPDTPRRVLRRSARPHRTRRAPVTRHRNLRALMKAHVPPRLFTLLQHAGHEAERQQVSLYAVGGFVRDLLLATPTRDVDLVVEGQGIRFARTFARAHQARVTAHPRFGTATVTFADGQTLDIATARTEAYAHPAALPTVTPSTITDDVRRRDFTINAMAVRLNTPHFGALVDHCGGQRDLDGATIRVLHDRSFLDDPTRVFRAIRLAQRLGFRLSRDTALLIRQAGHDNVFRRLSPARLSDAILHVFSEREPGKVLARLANHALLHVIHPRLHWSPGLARVLTHIDRALERHHRRSPDRPLHPWVVYSMALMETLPLPDVEAALTRFTFPRRHVRSILQVRREGHALLRALSQRQRVRSPETSRLLRNLPDEAILFLLATTRSEPVKRTLAAVLDHAHATPIFTGDDLKAMGLTPGPLYTTIMDRLWDAQLDGTVHTTTDARRLVTRLTTHA